MPAPSWPGERQLGGDDLTLSRRDQPLGFNVKSERPIHNTPVKAFLDVLLGLLG
jgi:hypothetical protein